MAPAIMSIEELNVNVDSVYDVAYIVDPLSGSLVGTAGDIETAVLFVQHGYAGVAAEKPPANKCENLTSEELQQVLDTERRLFVSEHGYQIFPITPDEDNDNEEGTE